MDRYHYIESGLDNVWLANGFEIVQTGHGEGIRINNVDGLHQAIGEHLLGLERALIGPEVRFLRESMDCTQRELGQLLGFSDGQIIRQAEAGGSRLRAGIEGMLRGLYAERMQTERRLEFRRLLEALRDAVDAEPPTGMVKFEEHAHHWSVPVTSGPLHA